MWRARPRKTRGATREKSHRSHESTRPTHFKKDSQQPTPIKEQKEGPLKERDGIFIRAALQAQV